MTRHLSAVRNLLPGSRVGYIVRIIGEDSFTDGTGLSRELGEIIGIGSGRISRSGLSFCDVATSYKHLHFRKGEAVEWRRFAFGLLDRTKAAAGEPKIANRSCAGDR
jgi:hypothetical protein